MLSFLGLLVDKEGKLAIDPNDEIIKAILLIRDGAIVNPLLTPSPAPAAVAAPVAE